MGETLVPVINVPVTVQANVVNISPANWEKLSLTWADAIVVFGLNVYETLEIIHQPLSTNAMF